MREGVKYFLIVMAVVVVCTGIAMIVSWQLGVFKKKSSTTTPAAPAVPVRREEREEQQGTFDSPDTPKAREIESSVDIESVLKNWLQLPADTAATVVEPDAPSAPQIVFGEWPCQRRVLQCPDPLQENYQFGYALDSQAQVMAVSAPGANCVYVYDANLSCTQKIQRTESNRFGSNCILSPTAHRLFVQDAEHVHVYERKEGGQYEFASSIDTPDDFQLLGCPSDTTLWLMNHVHGTTHIMELLSGTWESVEISDVTTMQIVTDSHTGQVWTSGASGVQNWSKNAQGKWTLNASWLENKQFTSIEFMDTFLAIGEAQRDQLSLVSSQNPHTIYDQIVVPGGNNSDTAVLFGERIVWWPRSNYLFASVPLDTMSPMRFCGAVVVYELSADHRLIPLAMLRATQFEPAAQFGSQIKLHGPNTVLITAPGAGKNKGCVEVLFR